MKFLIILSQLFWFCNCRHFYGGSITWKSTHPNSTNNINVLMQWRFFWLSSHSSNHRCDDTKILNSHLVGDTGRISCVVGCSPSSFDFDSRVICSDFSLANHWSSGQRSTLVTFLDPVYAEGTYAGNAWMTLITGGGRWELRFKMNLTKREDIQLINSPPTCLVNPITTMRVGCENTLKIYTADQNGDKVRCRWSSSILGECAGICNSVPGADLDEEKCMIKFKPDQIGYYAAAIQIEDFANTVSTSPLSSIPVQFLIHSRTLPCVYDRLEFQEPTLQDNKCTAVKFNETFNSKLVVFSNSQITEFSTLSPPGLVKSRIENLNNNQSLWYVNLTWTITDPDLIGINLFCFEAINIDGDKTDQRCISLVVNGISPIFENPSPTGLIDSNVSLFTIDSVNLPITKSTRQGSFIRIFDSNNNQVMQIESISLNVAVLSSKTLVFNVEYNFTKGETYHVLLDTNVAESTQYCGIESLPISNNTFWQFRIRNGPSINHDDNQKNNTVPINFYNNYVSSLMESFTAFIRKSIIAFVSTLAGSILLILILSLSIFLMCYSILKMKIKSSVRPLTKINLNSNHITLSSNHLEKKKIDSFNPQPIAILEDVEDVQKINDNNNLGVWRQNEKFIQQKPKRFVRDTERFDYKENPDSYIITRSNLFGYQSVSVSPKYSNLKILR